MARKRLGELLIQSGVLDEGGLRAALAEQRRWGGPLGRILIDMKLVAEDVLVRTLSQQLNFPVVNLDKTNVHPDVLDYVPGELAEQHSLLPFQKQGKFLDVAMSEPTNMGIIDELRIRTQLNVRPYLAGPKMIERALARFYGRGVGTLSATRDRGTSDPTVSGAFPVSVDVIDLEGGSNVMMGDPQPMGQQQHRPVRPSTSMPRGAPQSPMADPNSAAFRRAQSFGWDTNRSISLEKHEAEIRVLQERISKLEALVSRDEDVIRKLLGLLVEKHIASREEILDKIR